MTVIFREFPVVFTVSSFVGNTVSPVILKAQKMQTTFWNCEDYGYFVTINSRIWLLHFNLRINTVNYLKDQRRPSSFMFRRTTCLFNWFQVLLNTPEFIHVVSFPEMMCKLVILIKFCITLRASIVLNIKKIYIIKLSQAKRLDQTG